MQHRAGSWGRGGLGAVLAVGLMVLGTSTAATAGTSSALEVFLASNPGASRLSATSVAWDDGAAVMVFPASTGAAAGTSPLDQDARATGSAPDAVARATVNACPSGWSCLYEGSNFSGRRLQFQDCGSRQSLAYFGFNDQASAWVNNRGRPTNVWENVGGFGIIWAEAASSSSPNVGAADNDRASSISLDC